MIISASRRTDIPAFYSKWLINRIQEGYVLVPNPRSPQQFSQVSLKPELVDCIVFWTKNPAPMLAQLNSLEAMGYSFYFQFTLTPYGQEIEPYLPHKNQLLRSFQKLSDKIGPNRVQWRYDPVILSQELPIAYHLKRFEEMAKALAGYTHRCIFSFLDFYPRIKKSLYAIGARDAAQGDIQKIAQGFAEIGAKYHIQLSACSEIIDLSAYGITPAPCIDGKIIEALIGCPIRIKKDPNQRSSCRCMESIDIGTYHSCVHGCKYCYAVWNRETAQTRQNQHDPKSPALIGWPKENDKITLRRMNSLKEGQVSMF